MTNGLVQCKTTDGMFSNEVAVTLQLPNRAISLFADRDLIQEKDGVSYLSVTLFPVEKSTSLDSARVLLPSEAFETGTRWIDVPGNLMRAI